MAIRQIRQEGDEILRKISKPVKELNDKTIDLIGDMLETMYNEEGVGLAAVQVGVLKRLFVIDIGDGPVIFINPEIIETSGEQTGPEGCLSVEGYQGTVTRPNKVTIKHYDERMKETVTTGEGLMARAMIHEYEHLDGKLYVDKVEGELRYLGEPDSEDVDED